MASMTCKGQFLEDFKIPCNSCNHYRSFTLIAEDGICGICKVYDDADTTSEPHPDKSFICTCHTCDTMYAVVRMDMLKVQPRCHYCRYNKIAPNIVCISCRHQFVCTPKARDFVGSLFTCRNCQICSEAQK